MWYNLCAYSGGDLIVNVTAASANTLPAWFGYVTFAIAVFAFIMSAATWVLSFIRERKRIDVSVIDYSARVESVQLFMLFMNKSRLPISITSVAIVNGNKSALCELEPQDVKILAEKSGNVVTRQDVYRTASMPIYILPLGATQQYLEFRIAHLGLETPLARGSKVSLAISTNRGTINKTVLLGDTAHYLHLC